MDLITAVKKGDYDECLNLINMGCDVDKPCIYYGKSPLYYATIKGYAPICELLMSRGANYTEHSYKKCYFNDYYSLLYIAAASGFVDVCKVFLDNGINVNLNTDENKVTPLHAACSNKRLEVCKLLLDRGANVNSTMRDGITPFHSATIAVDKDICKLLLTYGANINSMTAENRGTPLHTVAFRGDNELCKILLENGADINIKDNRGSTPFHTACVNSNTAVCETLLAYGADLYSSDWIGTPLHCAKIKKNKDTIKLLETETEYSKAFNRRFNLLLLTMEVDSTYFS